MQGQNIIMVCQQNWDLDIDSNAKNLAKEFARHNTVMYVNMPLDTNGLLLGRSRPDVKKKMRVVLGQAEGLVQVEPKLWVCTPGVLCLSANWINSKAPFRRINRFNSLLLARSIGKAAKQMGFDGYYLFQDGIIFQALELPRLLRPRKFIYYLRDFTLTVPYFRQHGPWVEAEVMRRADVVVTNSVYLNDYARQHNQQNSHYIGQGCVLSLYQASARYAQPTELTNLSGPLIGYTGLLTGLRLHIDLLLSIARQRPNWNVVLIGPEDVDFQNSSLHELPNVFFLGRKPPEELPAYLSCFNVCINPQAINEVTVGNYPLKIDEYLAMGKPVVATRTRTMELFQDHVYLAEGEAEWMAQLEHALHDHDPKLAEARIGFAQSHTWKASADLLYAAIETAENEVVT